MKPSVLMVQPGFQPCGGAGGVGAWMLQALRDDYEVTALTWTAVDLDPVNRHYGTSLHEDDVRWVRVPGSVRALVDALPVPASHLVRSVLAREGRRRAADHDVLITANGEIDFGRPGIQYVHYPWKDWPRPGRLRWYHRPVLVRSYYGLCAALAGFTVEGTRRNVTLVNSAWIGTKIRRLYGIEPEVLFPPAPGDFPEVPWSERANRFVCVGRLVPEKRILECVEILARVRARGHEVELAIVGLPDHHPDYEERIEDEARRHGAWVRVERDVPRSELVALLGSSRYGIHGMLREHFGIAVAEMVRAGVVPFVPDDGGPPEIVGPAAELIYGSTGDAVDRIDRVLGDPSLGERLRTALAERAALFHPDRFTERIRELAGERAADRRAR